VSARGRRGGSFECPHCGAMVPVRAKACRECGSDAGTGWQDGDVFRAEQQHRRIVPRPGGGAKGRRHRGIVR